MDISAWLRSLGLERYEAAFAGTARSRRSAAYLNARNPATPAERRDREFADSQLEGGGFEPPVPLWRMAPGRASAELREVPAGQFAVRT